MRKVNLKTFVPKNIFVLFVMCIIVSAFGQVGGDYILTWSTIDGGGGVSSGGTYELEGTIGPPVEPTEAQQRPLGDEQQQRQQQGAFLAEQPGQCEERTRHNPGETAALPVHQPLPADQVAQHAEQHRQRREDRHPLHAQQHRREIERVQQPERRREPGPPAGAVGCIGTSLDVQKQAREPACHQI